MQDSIPCLETGNWYFLKTVWDLWHSANCSVNKLIWKKIIFITTQESANNQLIVSADNTGNCSGDLEALYRKDKITLQLFHNAFLHFSQLFCLIIDMSNIVTSVISNLAMINIERRIIKGDKKSSFSLDFVQFELCSKVLKLKLPSPKYLILIRGIIISKTVRSNQTK